MCCVCCCFWADLSLTVFDAETQVLKPSVNNCGASMFRKCPAQDSPIPPLTSSLYPLAAKCSFKEACDCLPVLVLSLSYRCIKYPLFPQVFKTEPKK